MSTLSWSVFSVGTCQEETCTGSSRCPSCGCAELSFPLPESNHNLTRQAWHICGHEVDGVVPSLRLLWWKCFLFVWLNLNQHSPTDAQEDGKFIPLKPYTEHPSWRLQGSSGHKHKMQILVSQAPVHPRPGKRIKVFQNPKIMWLLS